jgi:type I restriction-modification system DNA methylase subunit
MKSISSVAELTRALIESSNGNREALAAKFDVSLATILRWESGKSVPRPKMEGKIRSLFNERVYLAVQNSHYEFPNGETKELREALKSTLNEMREVLHRSGRLSSRHEALDELSKLLFAHIMSIDNGGTGINTEILDKKKPLAMSLRDFVSQIFKTYLPGSLAHELKAEDFQLRIKDSEDRFALEIIECFKRLSSPKLISEIRGARGVDVLNDTFGNFLADSFSDEKELGQYLTPPEVVRFMVRLAIQSLDDHDFQNLINPNLCGTSGLIIDPSCGVGSFLSEVLRVLQPQVQKYHGVSSLAEWIESMMGKVLVGIDKSERMIKLALTNLALFGVPGVNLHLANALVRIGIDSETTDAMNGKAKIILTNPPFGAEFSGEDLKKYNLANKWVNRSIQSIDSELLFIERYIDWLAPNGVLVAIVPDSVLTNKAIFSDLRKGIASSIEIQSVISLPAITFGVAGTSTKTSILHLKKKQSHEKNLSHKVYFGMCKNIGFDVNTRGSHRYKVINGTSELPFILKEILGESPSSIGRFVNFNSDEARWDATFHSSLPESIQQKLDEVGNNVIRVRDIAILSNDRIDPRRFGESTFKYIEISDVDCHDCTVRSKQVNTIEAPSRARKKVKTGDVLVSTVRPERKAIGVIPEELDGAICSTGFAVLRCTDIEPIILALLLQSDFVNSQLLRNNVGIAYPTIEESCLLDITLPVGREQLFDIAESAQKMLQLRQQMKVIEKEVDEKVEGMIEQWILKPIPNSILH